MKLVRLYLHLFREEFVKLITICSKIPIRDSNRTFQHLDNARMNCFAHKKSLQLLV